VAPRAYWKGYLKLSLVSCPIALYPATSQREKISFHQINKETGNRIKYRKVDAETGDEVETSDIIKGYEVGKGEYLEVEPEELEAIAIESKRTIEIDEFVPKKEIDELYLSDPYYLVPDGEVGQQAFAGHPRGDPRRGHGRARSGGLYLTRACHCARTTRQGAGRHHVAISLRIAQRGGLFFRHSQREDSKGHARVGLAHRQDEVRPFQTKGIRGPLRGSAQGAAEEKAGRREDRGAARTCSGQGHQPHGCASPLRGNRGRWTTQEGGPSCSSAPPLAEEGRAIECAQAGQGG
jgi:hypothetical protein